MLVQCEANGRKKCEPRLVVQREPAAATDAEAELRQSHSMGNPGLIVLGTKIIIDRGEQDALSWWACHIDAPLLEDFQTVSLGLTNGRFPPAKMDAALSRRSSPRAVRGQLMCYESAMVRFRLTAELPPWSAIRPISRRPRTRAFGGSLSDMLRRSSRAPRDGP
jgi:hypothetical protein